MHSDIVCGLDIGSSCVRTLVARMDPNYKEKILGTAESPTKGFSKNVVTNLYKLTDSIEDAVSNVERSSGSRVRAVTANISGVHIRTFKSRGSVYISDRPTEIKDSDIKRSIESARFIAMSLDRVLVHSVAQRFFIDDKIEILEPLGLFGSKLDVDLNIVTALSSILQNLTKAVNMAGYEVEDIILSGCGTALSVFDDAKMQEGAVLIDIGSELCEVSIFMNGKFWDCFYFPFGGDDLTQVLQENLGMNFPEADELRLKYLSCDEATREKVTSLLFPATKIVLEDAYKKIETFIKGRKSISNIYVLGGLSKMDGFIELAEDVFGVPVNLARVTGVKEPLDLGFATSLGLARYSAKKKEEERVLLFGDTTNPFSKVFAKIQRTFKEYF